MDKGRLVLNHVVGGKHNHHRIAIYLQSLEGTGCNGGGSVAAYWLQNDEGLLHANLGQLIRHNKAVALIANDNGRGYIYIFQPQQGFLNHSVLGG